MSRENKEFTITWSWNFDNVGPYDRLVIEETFYCFLEASKETLQEIVKRDVLFKSADIVIL